ncbi:MAG: hypothetical protein DIJKHBIC_04252 [Thermoanaerobaculia bacterium]|nr:hypothetical protein [Thermoanaerobaculia bacterium]
MQERRGLLREPWIEVLAVKRRERASDSRSQGGRISYSGSSPKLPAEPRVDLEELPGR